MDSFSKGGNRHRYKKSQSSTDGLDREDRKRQKVTDSSLSKDSPIFKTFSIFQEELDNRNNRYERIVKLSRDITIESKRTIFLLQRVMGSKESDKVLAEAQAKIHDLNNTKFLELAHELHGQDSYQYLRAYSPGLQEYIEAVTFYHYLLSEELVGLDKIQADLVFSVRKQKATDQNMTASAEINTPDCLSVKTLQIEPSSNDISKQCDGTTKDSSSSCSDKTSTEMTSVSVPVPPSEYMLGVADFTGELMRMAINSVGAGDLEKPSVVANMMRLIHNAFSTFAHPPRELYQKARVLRQSLQKVETACYTLKVRGSEMPKHMLADVFTISSSCAGDSYNEEISDVYDN